MSSATGEHNSVDVSRLLAGDRIVAFWRENSNGLAEIAVSQGRADRDIGLSIGTPVAIVT